MDTDTTQVIGRLASFISLKELEIREYDSSGLSLDVSLFTVCTLKNYIKCYTHKYLIAI